MQVSSPISILHITFDMRIGGTEQVIKNLIESNNQTYFDMSILCLESPLGPFGDQLKENGISIHCLARKQGLDLSLINNIRRHIKSNEIQIIHCHQYTPWVYGLLATIGTNVKVVFTEHGRFYPDSTTWKRRLINPVLLAFTEDVTAISKATRDALVTFEFIPHDKVKVIYNGIIGLNSGTNKTNLRQQLNITEDQLLVGTVARLDPIKNHQMMLHAFRLALDSGINAKLLIVGDGEERSNIESTITKLGLGESVILTGYIAKPQNYIDIMDIYLLSSLSEGTSMTLLEAMSLSKPCVVTHAGGNPEIILNGGNGFVTPNDDSSEFAQAIIRLCNDASLRKKMGEASRLRFKDEFSTTTMTGQFAKLYAELMEKE